MKIELNKNYITEKNKFLMATIFFCLFFLYSVKYKVDNTEAVRPLHFYGICLLVIAVLFLIIKNNYRISKYIITPPPQFLFVIFTILVFISSVFTGYRQLIDVLYFLTLYYGIYLVLNLLAIKQYNKNYFVRINIYTVIAFSIFASIISVTTILGFTTFEIGNYKLVQNSWSFPRLNGFMGEPTSLGALTGLSLFLLIAIKEKIDSLIFWAFSSITYLTLLYSGSVNGMLSCLTVVFLYYVIRFPVFMKNKRSNIHILSCMIILLLSILNGLGVKIGLDSPSLVRGDYLIEKTNDSWLVNVQNERIVIWTNIFGMFESASDRQLIFGHGSDALRTEYRAAFNSILGILYNYGAIAVVIYLLANIWGFLLGLNKYLTSGNDMFLLGALLLTYHFVFTTFISWFPTSFFNFAFYSFIFGMFLVNLPLINIADD